MTAFQFIKNEEIFMSNKSIVQSLKHLKSLDYYEMQDIIQILSKASFLMIDYLSQENIALVLSYQKRLNIIFYLG